MTIKNYRNRAKELGYQLKIKTVSFEDLARASKKVVEVYKDGKNIGIHGCHTVDWGDKHAAILSMLEVMRIELGHEYLI